MNAFFSIAFNPRARNLFLQANHLAIATIVVCPFRAIAAEQSTLFRQDSKIVGAADLLVSKSGIRLDMPRTNLTLIAHAPDWKLIFLSAPHRKYFVTIPGHFRAPATMPVSLFRTSDTSILKAKQVQPTILLGLKVNKVEMSGELPHKKGDPKWQKLLLHSATVWIDPTTATPPHVVHAIEEIYALPANKGVPLQMTTINNKGRQEKELTLLKVLSKPFKAADFAVPTNYSSVAAQEDLADKRSDAIMDLIP